jgi:hypothetical protein
MLKELNMLERFKISLEDSLQANTYQLLANNLLPNSMVTINDIKMAEVIFRANLGALKGIATRVCPTQIEVQQPNLIPIAILGKYNEVTLAIDVMFINNIPFFTSVSCHIKCGSAERLIN